MPDSHKADKDYGTADYEETSAYFRALHEVRFKLLALLPVVAGASVVLVPKGVPRDQQLVVSLVGFIVTVGLTIYDQRNTMIYDRLVRRGRMLEIHLGFRGLVGDSQPAGGAFWARPGRRKVLGVTVIWHDLGLALVYASSIAAWGFLATAAIANYRACFPAYATVIPTLKWVVPAVGFVSSFLGLWYLAKKNDSDNEPIDRAIRALADEKRRRLPSSGRTPSIKARRVPPLPIVLSFAWNRPTESPLGTCRVRSNRSLGKLFRMLGSDFSREELWQKRVASLS